MSRFLLKRPGEGRAIAVVGDVYRFLAVGEDTTGQYALGEAVGLAASMLVATLVRQAVYVHHG